MRHIFAPAASAVALALASTLGSASAQTTTMHHAVTPAAVSPMTARGPQHRFFGTLESATGTALVVRLRNGRDLHVDASEAFALKRVAEPLFRGKPTVVQGTLSTDGTLHATAVQRGAPNATHWGTDV